MAPLRPFAAFAALCAAPVLGQEPALADPPARQPVDTIIVTGRSLPDTPAAPAYATSVLDRDALTTGSSGRIEEALGAVAGFQQFRRSDSRSANPTAQGVTLRALGGNAAARALVTLDGVPMADPFFGTVPLSALAPDRLASAQVTRGGGSGPFGAGALAGTIALTSADAATLGMVSASALASDRGDSEISATLAPRLGDGFVVASGRWDRGDGFFTTPSDQRVPATARARYDGWSASVNTVAPLASGIELQARLLAFRDARTLRFRGADSVAEGQDASVRLVGTGRWQWEALGYVQARDFANTVISATRFTPTLDQRATPSTGLGGKLEVRPPVGDAHVLRLGADYRRGSGRVFENAISASGTVTERRVAGGVNTDLGLFVEDDWTRGPLTLTAGLRADRFTIREGLFTASTPDGRIARATRFADRGGWAGSVRGGALLRLGDGWRLRGAAYTGLRVPTLNELYRPFVVFPVTTRANAELVNERLTGFEAGADYNPGGGVSVSLTGFDNRVANAIANVTIAPNERQRRNIDAITARGIEASLAAKHGGFAFEGSLALTRARAQGTGFAAALDGKRPAQTPAFAAAATLGYEPAPQWRVALILRHTGAQFEDDRETDRLPPATVLGAYARVPIAGALALVLRAENIANARIVTRNQGGSIDLGAPRTLWAGLRWGR